MTMALTQAVFLLLTATLAMGQRGSFAGTKPIGFPEVQTTTVADGLGNRFGEDVTTQKLPLEALGDRDLVNRLSKLPEGQQSFWLLNAQALEAHRQTPQVYPIRPNSFVEPLRPEPVNPAPSVSQNVGTCFTGSTGTGNSVLEITNTPASQSTTQFAETSSSGNNNPGFNTPPPQNFISNRNGGTEQKANQYRTIKL